MGLLLAAILLLGSAPMVSAAAVSERNLTLWVEAGAGRTAENGRLARWEDVRGNGRALTQTATEKQPQLGAGGWVRFMRESSMTYSDEYEGEQTVFAVVRVGDIRAGDGFVLPALAMDWTAVAVRCAATDNKTVGYVPGQDWFVLGYRQSIAGGNRVAAAWVNGGKTADGLVLSQFDLFDGLGGGAFDVKAVLLYQSALSDADAEAVSLTLMQRYGVSGTVTADYQKTHDEMTAKISLPAVSSTDCIIIGALKQPEGTLVCADRQLVAAGEKQASLTLPLPAADDGMLALVYVWDAASLAPVCQTTGVKISDIGRVNPTTTQPPESSQTIPAFEPSLPEKQEMSLRLGLFDDPAPAYLAAKGWLRANYTYQPSADMMAADFSALLCAMTEGEPLSGGTLTRIGAVELLYAALKAQYRAYHRADSLPFGDVGSLSSAQTNALRSCWLSGIVEQAEEFRPNQPITQAEGLTMLMRAAVNEELAAVGRGAEPVDIPYHAKYAETNGVRLLSTADAQGVYEADNIAFETEGKECVTLEKAGDGVIFYDVPAANRITVRYSIPKPDKAYSGSTALPIDNTATVGLYVNGVRTQTLTLHSLPLYTAKDSEGYKNCFTDLVLSQPVRAGDRVELRLSDTDTLPPADDFSHGISVSQLRFASAPEARLCPAGYINAAQYGAAPDDGADDTLAIEAAVRQAYLTGTGVYLPPGTYLTGRKIKLPSGVTLTGAGMWHTTVDCPADNVNTRGGRTGFTIDGEDVEISHLKISASANYRRTGNTASCINGIGARADVHHVWMDKGGVGLWAELYQSRIADCRVTDSFADGIHLTGPSQDVLIENNTITGGGDDGIATTGDTRKQSVLTNITIRHNTVMGAYHGRGIMLSGTAHSVIEDNYVTYIYRNPAILAWTEGTYDTMSVYDITIRRNIAVACRRNPGLHRGAITLFCNREAHWADGDIYDNETYKNQFIHGYYAADWTGADGAAARTYCELGNNIAHMAAGTGYHAAESYLRDARSVMRQGSLLELKF